MIGGLSVRFWECNPSGLYGSSDVVHQLVYALLLLNTDLHVVDQDRKMSRDGFVENTMGSIKTWAESRQLTEPVREDAASLVSGKDVVSDTASSHVAESSANSTLGKARSRNRSGSMASSFRDRLTGHEIGRASCRERV